MSQEEIVERISKLEAQLQALSPKEQEPVKHPIEKVRTVAKFSCRIGRCFRSCLP